METIAIEASRCVFFVSWWGGLSSKKGKEFFNKLMWVKRWFRKGL